MTHVKTADAFARLVGLCTGYGGSYNPGRPTLQIDSLTERLTSIRTALQQVRAARVLHEQALNERKAAFEGLPLLASSVMNALMACGATPALLSDARYSVQMLTGRKRKAQVPPADDGSPEVKGKSMLQLAFVSQADSFANLVETVLREPLYTLQEPHLSKQGLRQKVAQLQALNEKAAQALLVWRNAIIERNKVMYQGPQSVVSLARAVKRYVRAIFGLASAEYRQVQSLVFVKPNVT